ncbi:GNS1/SUR4 family protein [Leishmania donovani]|uniref:Elongation of fatty acids protein n=2 Tax=Leishmania donovani TaxID=5661 RepID=A0A504XBC6_LEIDO|nr:GNS1/SUR4 family protein [Leishmania donovani]
MFEMLNPFHYLDDFRGDVVCAWMRANLEIPSVVTVLYIVMVLYVPRTFMKHRPAYNLRALNLIWNLGLSLFSCCGAYYCLPEVFKSLFVSEFTVRNFSRGGTVTLHGSFYKGVCGLNADLFCDGPVGAFVCLFILSKIPEMLDTAFLVFQKKPVIFLHWYHHVTVMLYCWHSYAMNISGGLVFAGMNYGVHSIMYFYFFICSCGYRKYVRPFAPLITFLQIAQMVVGMFTEVYTLYHMYVSGKGCQSNATNARVGLMMYMSYFGLFSRLFYDSYLSRGKKQGNTEASAGTGHKRKRLLCTGQAVATVEGVSDDTRNSDAAPSMLAKRVPDVYQVKRRH